MNNNRNQYCFRFNLKKDRATVWHTNYTVVQLESNQIKSIEITTMQRRDNRTRAKDQIGIEQRGIISYDIIL